MGKPEVIIFSLFALFLFIVVGGAFTLIIATEKGYVKTASGFKCMDGIAYVRSGWWGSNLQLAFNPDGTIKTCTNDIEYHYNKQES